MALDMPLYMAPGEGLIIWILVFRESALCLRQINGCRRSCIPSGDRPGTSPSAPVSGLTSVVYVYSETGAYGDTRERACEHVRGEGKVWRESFIAGAIVSDLFPAEFAV